MKIKKKKKKKINKKKKRKKYCAKLFYTEFSSELLNIYICGYVCVCVREINWAIEEKVNFVMKT